jgi:hypothetical protein
VVGVVFGTPSGTGHRLIFFFSHRGGRIFCGGGDVECSASLSAVSELFFTRLGIVDQDAASAIRRSYKVAAYLYLVHAPFNEAV